MLLILSSSIKWETSTFETPAASILCAFDSRATKSLARISLFGVVGYDLVTLPNPGGKELVSTTKDWSPELVVEELLGEMEIPLTISLGAAY